MIRSLEGLRGVAAVMVALFHLRVGAAYIPMVQHGYLFVDLFFVLSGFVITVAYAHRLRTPRQFCGFVVRRWGRVFPMLFAGTVLFVLVRNVLAVAAPELMRIGLAAPGNAARIASSWPTWGEVLSTATLTHSMGTYPRLILNFASWSVSTEFWTYVLFAFVCVTLPRRPRLVAIAAIALIACVITVRASIGSSHRCTAWGRCMDLTFDYGYARCVAAFLLGSLASEVRTFGRGWARRAQGAVLVALAGLFFLLNAFPAVAFLFPAAFAVLVWSLADDGGRLAAVLSGRVGAILGQRSYSIYLLHPVLLLVIWSLGGPPAGVPEAALVLALYLGLLVFLSGPTYRLIEAPARALCNVFAGHIEGKGAGASLDASSGAGEPARAHPNP